MQVISRNSFRKQYGFYFGMFLSKVSLSEKRSFPGKLLLLPVFQNPQRWRIGVCFSISRTVSARFLPAPLYVWRIIMLVLVLPFYHERQMIVFQLLHEAPVLMPHEKAVS